MCAKAPWFKGIWEKMTPWLNRWQGHSPRFLQPGVESFVFTLGARGSPQMGLCRERKSGSSRRVPAIDPCFQIRRWRAREVKQAWLTSEEQPRSALLLLL